MKNVLFILFVLFGHTGCTQFHPQTPTPKPYSSLRIDFSIEFDRLFLSNEPLRYQDNKAFLEAIRFDEFTTIDKELIRTKTILFLSIEDQNREYTADCEHTGVASEIAFLRLQAIQVLAEVGTSDDIEFIQNLMKHPVGEHPLFQDQCRKSIEQLNYR
ncbi:MAG: hypothetical protein MUO76_24790 [Anaerolineaceae bacterium]|nr:hypothetical protein [Anaerolineaceae bacterium]